MTRAGTVLADTRHHHRTPVACICSLRSRWAEPAEAGGRGRQAHNEGDGTMRFLKIGASCVCRRGSGVFEQTATAPWWSPPRRRRRIAEPSWTSWTAACDDATMRGRRRGTSRRRPRRRAPPSPRSTSDIISPICVQCHNPQGIGVSMGHLDMSTKAAAFTDLVGVAAMGIACGGMGTRVVAGNASSSIMFEKVDPGTPAPCGSKMPLGLTATHRGPGRRDPELDQRRRDERLSARAQRATRAVCRARPADAARFHIDDKAPWRASRGCYHASPGGLRHGPSLGDGHRPVCASRDRGQLRKQQRQRIDTPAASGNGDAAASSSGAGDASSSSGAGDDTTSGDGSTVVERSGGADGSSSGPAAARSDASSSSAPARAAPTAFERRRAQMHKHINRDGFFVDSAFTETTLMGATLHLDATFAGTFTGNVYASPIYVQDGVDHKGTFYVATESNNLYALDETTGMSAIPRPRTPASRRRSTGCACVEHPSARHHRHAGDRSRDAPHRLQRGARPPRRAGSSRSTRSTRWSIDDFTEKWSFDVSTLTDPTVGAFASATQNQRSAVLIVERHRLRRVRRPLRRLRAIPRVDRRASRSTPRRRPWRRW